jgi:hypothetical protein
MIVTLRRRNKTPYHTIIVVQQEICGIDYILRFFLSVMNIGAILDSKRF